jgi:predicted ATPase
MGSQTEIISNIELKPLTIIIGKNPVENSLLLRQLWASVATDDAVYLPAGRAYTTYDRPIRLSRSAELLLRDIGIEIYVTPLSACLKTRSGKKFELAHAPPGVKEVIVAIFALSSNDFRFVFIEEPEAHLHPSAQRFMARVIAEAVNNGKFVVLTTHSDYLISEFNNLIALSNAPEDVRKKLGYRDAEVVKPEQVVAYLVKAEDGRAVVECAKVAEEILEIRNEL